MVNTAEEFTSCGATSSSAKPAGFSMTEPDPKRKRAIEDEGDQDIDLRVDHYQVEVGPDDDMDSGTTLLSICESPLYGDAPYQLEGCVELFEMDSLRGEWLEDEIWNASPVGGHLPSDG